MPNEEVAGPAEPVVEEQPVEQEAEGGVSAETTAAQVPGDAPTDIDRLRSVKDREIAAERKRAETLQQYLERMQAELKARDDRLYKIETAEMDETQKSQYDAQRQLEELNSQIAARQRQMQEWEYEQKAEEIRDNAVNFYAYTFGIPRAEVEKHSYDGPDALNDWVDKNYARQFRQSRKAAPPKPPSVTTSTPTKSGDGILSKWDKMTPTERAAVMEEARQGGMSLDRL